MLKKVIASFILAFHNIRSHFFHTILSILGIVIGVAALVSILSLIDGMEQFAKDQITKTTSLNAIMIRPQVMRNVNGVSFRKDSVDFLDYADFLKLKSSLTMPAEGFMWQIQPKEILLENDTIKSATNTTALSELDTSFVAIHGRLLTRTDLEHASPNAIITQELANQLTNNKDLSSLINKKITISDRVVTIVGVARSSRARQPELFFPITLLTKEELMASPPQCIIEAGEVIHVQPLKAEIMKWIKQRYGNTDDFSVQTNELRVEQAAQGFKLFRIIMGLIVGISVVVGGIGVMNVLLISVTERTVEIGIRKAVGANRKDIILQFLSESITISLFGSLLGLVIGVLGTMIIIPIIKVLTQIPFQAAYTANTLMVVSILAFVVGIVFGTYPAMRASRLDPVEAIRRE